MVFKTEELLVELKEYVHAHIKYAKELKTIPEETLQQKSDEKSWSVLDCIAHLNLYAVFYNDEINKRMEASSLTALPNFKSSYLGNKFAVDMLPKEGMKTMRTFKSKNPIFSRLNKEEVLDDFIKNQEELLVLLTLAAGKNISKIKTSLTIPILKFRLGDTFRFVIYHNERHIVQARKGM